MEILNKSMVKENIETSFDLHPFFRQRWSPRSFSNEPILEEQVLELIEAARWAPSANNEQPWLFYYGLKGATQFDDLWNTLAPGNRPWAKNAAVLMVTMIRKTFTKNGNPNPWALHDLGMANAQLILQATHRNIYGHFMAGFDKGKIKETLTLPEDIEPVAMLALGHLGNPEQLEEPYKGRELSARSRLPIQDIIYSK